MSDLRPLVNIDRVIHEPVRLALMITLSSVDEADFIFLYRQIELTKGNLATHLAKLEQVAYIMVEKTFRGKIPHTTYRLTDQGRAAFAAYRACLKTVL